MNLFDTKKIIILFLITMSVFLVGCGSSVNNDTIRDNDTLVGGSVPIITLIGGNPIDVPQGNAFVDPGATASDTEDGDLSANIVVSGIVDSSVAGIYAIIYTVTDSAGNVTSIIRNVRVYEAPTPPPTSTPPPADSPPVIILIGANPLTLKVGDTFIDPGATATDKEDGDLTLEIVTTGTVDTSVAGTYQVSYMVTDSAGNKAKVVRNVVVSAAPAPPPDVLKKTGQTTEYTLKDDGAYQKGIDHFYTQNADETVTDNVTQLVWQNDLNQAQIKVANQPDAIAQCSALALGGFNDWRLPTIEELQYIVHKGYFDPAISPKFLNTEPYFYWSSSSENRTNQKWLIYFEAGSDHYRPVSFSDAYVRCVRGTSTSSSFSKNGDIVTDKTNKLEWQDNIDVTTNSQVWTSAIAYCEGLSLDNKNDWRLPNLNELLSISDKNSPTPPAIKNVFSYVEAASSGINYTVLYWSSTTSLEFTVDPDNRAYTVNFYYGDEYDYGTHTQKSKSNYVRCVRNIP